MDATEKVIQASADAMATLSAMEALLVEGASPSPDDLGQLVNTFVTNLHVLHESGNETVSAPYRYTHFHIHDRHHVHANRPNRR